MTNKIVGTLLKHLQSNNEHYDIPGYDAIVYKRYGRVIARDFDGGQIDNKSAGSSNDYALIQAAHDAMSARQRLLILGDMSISTAINITKGINIDHYGKATLTGSDPYLVFDASNLGVPKIRLQQIDGQNKSRDGIKVLNGLYHAFVYLGYVVNCNKGINFASDAGSTAAYGDMVVSGDIEACNYGIFYDTPGGGGEPAREGLVFAGSMFGNSHGIYVSSGTALCGAIGIGPHAVIDNASVGGSWDFEDYGNQNLPHIIRPKFIRGSRILSTSGFKVEVPNAVRANTTNRIRYPLSSAWQTAIVGAGGTATYNAGFATLTTAGANGDGIQIYVPTNFLSNQAQRAAFRISPSSLANCIIRAGLVATPSAFVDSDTVQGIQAKWDGVSWKGEISDGATGQEKDSTNTADTDMTVIIQYLPNVGAVVIFRSSNIKPVYTVAAPLPNTTLGLFFNIKATTAAAKTLQIHQQPVLEYLA